LMRVPARDRCVLEYIQEKAAAANQPGSGRCFMEDGPGM
jgi:hypothetical protein